MVRQSELERRAVQIIVRRGDVGILQSELWRKLNTSSRIGSRLAIKLEREGAIERKRELHNGRWTYRIFTKIRPVTVDSIMDIPCTSCPDISKCGFGGAISPERCQKLDLWLQSIANDLKNKEGQKDDEKMA